MLYLNFLTESPTAMSMSGQDDFSNEIGLASYYSRKMVSTLFFRNSPVERFFDRMVKDDGKMVSTLFFES